jgi:hypothetical protein
MYTLPDHLKSISAIKNIIDLKYKLTELGSLLEFLLKEIDQDQNPTFSLGELIIQYSNLFVDPKSVSTAIAIRNLKIHGPKPGGRIYTQQEIEQAPEQLFRAIDDLLPHVPSNVAEAVGREEFDLGAFFKTILKEVQSREKETPKQITPPPKIKPQVVPQTSNNLESSSNGASIVGGIVVTGLALWGLSALFSPKTSSPQPATKQQTPFGCIFLIILMVAFILIIALSAGGPK